MTLLTLNATRGALSRKASHCPLSRKNRVSTACAAISGRMNCQRRSGQGKESESMSARLEREGGSEKGEGEKRT